MLHFLTFYRGRNFDSVLAAASLNALLSTFVRCLKADSRVDYRVTARVSEKISAAPSVRERFHYSDRKNLDRTQTWYVGSVVSRLRASTYVHVFYIIPMKGHFYLVKLERKDTPELAPRIRNICRIFPSRLLRVSLRFADWANMNPCPLRLRSDKRGGGGVDSRVPTDCAL